MHADQLDSGSISIDRQQFLLSDLVADVMCTVDSRRINITLPDEGLMHADYQYVRIILANLLGNALKYSPPESMVELRVRRVLDPEGGSYHFHVANLIGKAGTPDPARLFSRYYRSEGARSFVGAGLGLWLAQTLAGQHGSEILFVAEQTQVCFNFRIGQA
jgi:signal transduction histidine kinase